MFNHKKPPSRLGQWNGRKRSSRSEDPVLPYLRRREVLLRLAPAFLTALAITYLASVWGSPLPYRLGEISRRDLRVRVYFELINQPQTDQARDEAVERLPPELAEDLEAREEARRAVPPVIEKYTPGTLLVPRGKPITERQIALLEEEHRAYQQSLGTADHARRAAGLYLIMNLLALVVVLYAVRFQPGLAHDLAKIGGVCVLAVTTVALALFLSPPPWHAVLLPLTVTALVLTIAYNAQFALLMSVALALATTVAHGAHLSHLLIQLGGLAMAVLMLRSVRTRTRLVQVCAAAGLAYLAMTVATGLMSGQTATFIAADAGRNFVWGTSAGFLLGCGLPLIEMAFGVITDVSLSELADGSHPLLQELVRRAPGTYTHSITVATLAEAAAEAIGANPLLARVGSSFHDIGKMLKPQYFIENQSGENRHDFLEPALSTLVIIGHVKDGVALARQYKLPQSVIDIIEQHHGTTLVEYFYHEAVRAQAENGGGAGELEATFRYPGPRPQTRETAIVMLADAVESTSRALTDPATGSLRKLVHELLMKRLLDGQFEESGLTLTELHAVEESLCKSLIALYHARIKYPDKKLSDAAP